MSKMMKRTVAMLSLVMLLIGLIYVPMEAQAANDFSQLIERFEKRIHDLKLTFC